MAAILKIYYGRHLSDFLSRTVVFSSHKNICVDTKLLIVCRLAAEMLIEICQLLIF